ncbi:MAG: pyridoxine 5'-phosphate synthase [Phycisphaeraceae bacterium]|nr:pyridoxine 5'-phosphate synthase [Phycisphaeraceae bacterium]
MTKLSVNVNKIALLRNQRTVGVPSVVGLSATALQAGAHGITVHPRPDARHIRPSDVDELSELLSSNEWDTKEFNIEGNPLDFGGGHLMPILRRVKPTQATLVPDDPAQNTSDHGWDVVTHLETLKPIVAELKDLGCRVSLFLDPDPEMAKRAADTGTDRIELYTESYAQAYEQGGDVLTQSLAAFTATAEAAESVGLGVNAGHDLNLDNLPGFVAIPNVLEVSIGHALVADALAVGMKPAVEMYLTACTEGKS